MERIFLSKTIYSVVAAVIAVSLLYAPIAAYAASFSVRTPVVHSLKNTLLGKTAVAETYVTITNGEEVTLWFEWGENGTFYKTSDIQKVTQTGIVSGWLGYGTPGTPHSVRVAARGGDGVLIRSGATTFRMLGEAPSDAPVGYTGSSQSGTYSHSYNGTAYTGSTGETSNFALSGGPSPVAQTFNPTNVTDFQATLVGHTYPGNGSNVSQWFEWGLGNALGNRTEVGHITQDVDYVYTLTGLKPDTTYFYRAVVRNDVSTHAGRVISFTTKSSGGTYGILPSAGGLQPIAGTGPGQSSGTTVKTTGVAPVTSTGGKAPVVAGDTATLSATVLPGGNDAWGYFEYGTSPDALTMQTDKKYLGNDNLIEMTGEATELLPKTTYYYRSVVETADGTSRGSVMSFEAGGTSGATSGSGVSGSGVSGSGSSPSSSGSAATGAQSTSRAKDDSADAEGASQAAGSAGWSGWFTGDDNLGAGDGDATDTSTKAGVVDGESQTKGSLAEALQDKLARADEEGGVLGFASSLRESFFTVDDKGVIARHVEVTEPAKKTLLASAMIGAATGVLPNSFMDWLLWVIVLYLLISRIRAFMAARKKRKEEKEERKRQEEELRYQNEKLAENNSGLHTKPV